MGNCSALTRRSCEEYIECLSELSAQGLPGEASDGWLPSVAGCILMHGRTSGRYGALQQPWEGPEVGRQSQQRWRAFKVRSPQCEMS